MNEISHGQHRLHPFLYTHFSTYKDNQLYVKTMGSEHTQSVVSLHIETSCDELRIVYVTEHGKRAQLTWSIIFYFFTLLEPALHYLTMDT